MRVLFWSDSFWPYIGGPEVLSAALLPALQDLGCEIVVVTSHHNLDLPDEETFQDLAVYRFPFHQALANGDFQQYEMSLKRLRELKERFRPELIHIGAVGPSVWFHLRTRRTPPAPVLATLQREVLPSEMNGSSSVLGELLRSSDWIRTVSNVVLEQARTLVPEIRDRSSVIYSFCREAETPYVDPGPENKRILCLGRHVSVKGFDLAVRAFDLVRRRVPEARLVIAGDGPERAHLVEKAAAMQLDGRIEFPGWIAPRHVLDLMRSVAVVFIPSWSEGLPTVAIQALQSGRPMVATSVGGLPEIVRKEHGLLVPAGDVAQMVGALCELLEDPLRARAMGRRAAGFADRFFGKEKCVSSFFELYQQLLRNRSSES